MFASQMAFGIAAILSVVTLAYCCCKITRGRIIERETQYRQLEVDKEFLKYAKDPETRMLVIERKIVRQKMCHENNVISLACRKDATSLINTHLACRISDLGSSANLSGSDNQCEEDQDDNICSICLEPFEPQQDIAWARDKTCFHCFHSACLVPWLMIKRDCPCCRKELLRKQDFLSVYQNLKVNVDTNITDSDGGADEEQGAQEFFAIINGQVVVFGASDAPQQDGKEKDELCTDFPIGIETNHC